MKHLIFVLVTFFISHTIQAGEECQLSPGMSFFNNISGQLEINLSKPAQPMQNLPGNLVSPEGNKVVSVSLEGEIFIEESETYRGLTDEELGRIAYKSNTITLRGESERAISHSAPNGEHFTVKDLLKAVEATELQTRGNSEWFGGIDVHHIYFEGMECNNGVWSILWGS